MNKKGQSSSTKKHRAQSSGAKEIQGQSLVTNTYDNASAQTVNATPKTVQLDGFHL